MSACECDKCKKNDALPVELTEAWHYLNKQFPGIGKDLCLCSSCAHKALRKEFDPRELDTNGRKHD